MNNDLISRSDALKAVDARHEELLHDTEYRRKHCQIDLLGIKKHILAIPPVEPEKGEWGEWIISEIQCPNCFRYFETDYYSTEELKKCPNCGADMRGGAK